MSVYYVDYGNTSTVPLASVGVIPPALVARLPAQAVQCRLSGVHSNTADTVDRSDNTDNSLLSIQASAIKLLPAAGGGA